MADQARDEAGNIWEVDAQGNPVRLIQPASSAPQGYQIGGPDPSLALDRSKKQLEIAKALREARSAPVQDARDEVALQAARINLEADRRKLSEQPTGKPLRQGDGDALEKQVGTYAALKGALGSFNNDYAGNSVTGGLENKAQRLLGTGTPGQSDWWANFAATDNVIRNSLYGASLTDGEKQAYDATTINPSMRPELIRQNLERRSEIIRGALGRKINRFKAGGYNPAEIDAATGEFGSDFAPGYKPQKHAPDSSDKTIKFYGNAAAANGDGGGDMQLATGTQTVADPVLKGVNAKINGMLKSGASDDEIRKYIASTGANASPASVAAALDFRRKNRDYKGNYSVNLESKDIPLSTARQAFQSVGAGPVGAYATGAADALTAGRLDNIAGAMGGNAAQVDAAKALLAKANPVSSIVGNVTGGALAMGGLEAGIAASGLRTAGGIIGGLARSPLAADAAYGALSGSDEGGVTGAVLGAGLGVAGGAAGSRVAGAIGGVRNEAAQALRARGIPLTLGQAVGQSGRVGGAIKGIEDRLSGIPVIGAFANARRREGIEGYNRAAFDEALAPIGQTTNGLIAETGIEAAQNAVGDSYNSALSGVNVRADLPFVQSMAGAMRGARSLPDPMSGRADYTLRTRVGNSFSPNRELTGEGYQQSLRGLRRDASAVRNEPYGYDFGNVAGQAEDALGGLLDRQAPGVVPAVERANQAYRQMQVLKEAVNKAKNGARSGEPGLFAPSQLVDASSQNARRFGGTQGTTNQPFFALNRDAQTVLPNAVPDSGTAGRLALTGLLAGGGAGAGYFGDDTGKGLAIGGALAALQTQAAQRLLVRAVLDRPELLRRVGDSQVASALGRGIGAPVALQALPSR